jgi:hypothetical protein
VQKKVALKVIAKKKIEPKKVVPIIKPGRR